MKPHTNLELNDPQGQTIQSRPKVATVTANIGAAKADSIKPAEQNVDLDVEVKIETEPNKSELVILWLFIAAMMILTVVAGYLLWKKVNSPL